jgi:hypothetical protein
MEVMEELAGLRPRWPHLVQNWNMNTGQRVRAAGQDRGRRIRVRIGVALLVLAVGTALSLQWLDPNDNFQTLRSDLAKVHLPPGYRLVKTQEAGTTHCNFFSCTLTQTWAWAPNNAPWQAPCTDVYQALSSAFSGVISYSPTPPDNCDYVVTLDDPFGQGKRTVEVTVRTDQPQANHGFLVELTDTFP